MSELTERLITGAARMGIEVAPDRAERFAVYHEMLVSANRQFNLTRVPDELSEAVDRNYLDCIAPLAHGLLPASGSLIDVGSGAGFPGLPLAILLPNVHVVLLDSLGKRVKFLQSVVDELHLNAEAVHARCEDAAREAAYRERFDIACARAVAPLNVLSEYLLPFVRVGGRAMALKGPGAEDELKQAQKALNTLGGQTERVEEVRIPERDWSHTVVYIQKLRPTPQAYPRKAGTPEKKPIGG